MSELSAEQKAGIFLASGNAHPELSEGIASAMDMELGRAALTVHPSTDKSARYEDNMRGRHAILIQPHARDDEGGSVSDAMHMHLEMINAAKEASARRITVVAPILAGSRQDRQTEGRESISIALTLQLLEAAGADRIVTVDLHTPQSLVAFRGSKEHLPARPLLQAALEEQIEGDKDDYVLVSPDAGRAKLTQAYGRDMELRVVNMNKYRDGSKVEYPKKIGGVKGRNCLMVDDLIDTGGTIVSAAEVLSNSGADEIVTVATHGLFSDPAIERLNGSPIDRVIVTDTVPLRAAREGLGDKLQVVSVAGMIADTLVQVATDGSVLEKVYGGHQHE